MERQNLHEQTPEQEQEKRKKAAIRISVITAGLMGILFVYQLFTATTPIGMISTGLITGVAIASVILSYYGRSNLGIILLISTILLTNMLAALNVSGAALVLSGIVMVLTVGISINTLPPHITGRLIVAAAATCIIAILADFFGSPDRLSISNPTVLVVMAIVVLLVYGVLVVRNFPNFSLRAKLITATATVAIIAVLTVTIIVGITTRNALVEQIGTNLNGLSESQSLAIGELISRQVNTLEALALNRAVTDALFARNAQYANQSDEEIQESIQDLSDRWETADNANPLVLTVLNNSTSKELNSFERTFPDHVRIMLTDEQGAVVAASKRPERFFYGDEVWWDEAYVSGFGSVFIGEPYIDPDIEDVVIDIAVPVRSTTATGRTTIGGVLISTYRLSQLANVMVSLIEGRDLELELYFNDGWELEVESENEQVNYTLKQVDTDEFAQLQEIANSNIPYFFGNVDGISGLLSLARVNTLANEPRVDRLGWQAAIFQSEETALASVAQQLESNILLGVAIVVIASITAAVVANFLARPITDLTTTVTQVAEGDLSARATVTSRDEIGQLAFSINQMAGQLQGSIEGLEERINERTLALTTSIEVSRSLSTILDPTELAVEVVEQVRTAFDYYYVQIYLLDDDNKTLKMFGGTGEAGQAMLARGHNLKIGQGLVGQAAFTNTPVFIPDVSQSDSWQANPLLPDTKAEIALPIVIGSEVLGVLDVQHDVTEGLSENDVTVLQSVAFQVAIALQNARSYERAKKQAEREATLNAVNQRIQNANSIDDVLKIAVEEVGRAMGNQKARIELHNPIHAPETNGRQS